MEKKEFNVTDKYVSYSQKNDFPYNFSEAPEAGDFKRFFAILVDFGEFREERSKLFVVGNKVNGRIYQLKDGEIISTSRGHGPIGEYNKASNNLTMCRNSSIHLESIETGEFRTEVKISNPGSEKFNGNYRGELNITFTRSEGSKTTKNVNTIFLPDSKEQYDLNFEIPNAQELTEAEMKPLACPTQTQTVNELPLK